MTGIEITVEVDPARTDPAFQTGEPKVIVTNIRDDDTPLIPNPIQVITNTPRTGGAGITLIVLGLPLLTWVAVRSLKKK